MDIFTLLIIAFGLAMDAFAVSIACGCSIKKLRTSDAIKTALFFGAFQAFMPVLGWSIGLVFRNFVLDIGYWIAFVLLVAIGLKMIYESTKLNNKSKRRKDILDNRILLILAIATSIDAFVVGASLSFLNVSIIEPAVIIGIVTFSLSFIGAFIGKKMGHLFESKIEILGGLILILIGLKTLLENLIS